MVVQTKKKCGLDNKQGWFKPRCEVFESQLPLWPHKMVDLMLLGYYPPVSAWQSILLQIIYLLETNGFLARWLVGMTAKGP